MPKKTVNYEKRNKEMQELFANGFTISELAELFEITETRVRNIVRDTDEWKAHKLKTSREQLCWTCANATGFCEWSRKGKPVPGWDAEGLIVKLPDHRVMLSYDIMHCPKYRYDGKSVLNREKEMKEYYEMV